MKIGFISLGCPKNLVDSEVMLGTAEQAGHEITTDADGADVVIVNTCAFIDRAKQESIDTILEMAEKKKATGARLVVTGCLAERYRASLQQEIPEIDAVLGTGDVPHILDALQPGATPAARTGAAAPLTFYRRDSQTQTSTGPAGTATPAAAAPSPAAPSPAEPPKPQPAAPVFGVDLPTYLYDATTPRRLATPGHYAYVKIAEGCDYKCAFCVIPKMRGHYRSRTVESVVDEARALAARGVKELLLVSQDTTFYGIDRQEREALPRLIRALDDVDGLEWVRLLYLYPTTITEATIEAMAASRKTVRYIDLPLQHASDAVLKRMKRPGTRASYERLLAGIRARMPDVTLRTTFIVGFPGETAADVDELLGFIRTVGFDHVGVFTYSHEEDTSAYALEDDVPAAEKARRQRRVMALQKRLVATRQKARVGSRARLMVDGASADHDWVFTGRLPGQAPDIDPMVYLTEADPSALRAGQVLEVEIVEARGYDLVARPLDL
ncbi:MAG: 30S ribosomal protein S12 methylthiotransferase RimO [Vicinamibacterales bacterium]